MRSRTYLDWPDDEGDRVHFWDRLRRNIAAEDMVSIKKKQETGRSLNDTEIGKINDFTAQTSKLMLQERIMLQTLNYL